MTATTYDVLGIGNAIVDIVAKTEDSFLAELQHVQGSNGADRRSAGCCDLSSHGTGHGNLGRIELANTIAGVADFGHERPSWARCATTSSAKRVRSRYPGYEGGVRNPSALSRTGNDPLVSSRHAGCRARSINAYLGVDQDPSPADIDPARMASSSIVYLEGYLWDPKERERGFRKGFKDRT